MCSALHPARTRNWYVRPMKKPSVSLATVPAATASARLMRTAGCAASCWGDGSSSSWREPTAANFGCAFFCGWTKYSISACVNSRCRMRPERGAISLRNALPICAMPKGTLTRPVDTTFLKFVKMPCAVSGRRKAVEAASDMAPTEVWNMRLKSRGAVSAPGLPVSGDGMRGCSSAVASVKSLSGERLSSPWRPAFFFIFVAIASARSSMSPLSSSDTYPSSSPPTSARAQKSWSARKRSLDSLQSTIGSEKPSMWPDAFQICGEPMMDESSPTMSSRLCTKSFHHARLMLLRSSTPSGP
mmetsp:Transcript_43726/g.140421  ORF Transcript_43726/g.140421 Transcript_43726/m.140421 type:complete len:300 (-) Transcript_43726:372-1271(-)